MRQVQYFTLERADLGGVFVMVKNITSLEGVGSLSTVDKTELESAQTYHYRVKALLANVATIQSNTLTLTRPVQGVSLTLFPNPADEVLTIRFNLTEGVGEMPVSVSCWNAAGQIVGNEHVSLEPNRQELSLYTRDWPNGWYVLRMNLQGRYLHRSFMVQHP